MNEEIAVAPAPAADTAARSRYLLWAWIQQHIKSDAAKTAFAAWLALRLYCTLLGIALYNIVPPAFFQNALPIVFGGKTPDCPQYTQPATGLNGALAGIWLRWDTAWYVEIARHGYSCYGSTAFLPLYPLLIRGSGVLLGGNTLAAALLISSFASLIAFYLLYRLAEDLTGSPAIARASVVALALFPTAFFLIAGYTEALFLALAIVAYLAARRGHWLAAGILAALATLTRLQGIALLVPLGLELWLAHRSDLRRWRAWLSLTLSPLALALYAIFIQATQGITPPWEPLSSARGPWRLHYVWPWQGITHDLGALLSQPDLGTLLSFKLLDPLSAILFAVCVVVAFRRLNVPLGAFLAVMWLTSVIKVTTDGYTTSISRYMLALFPAFIVLGMIVARWPRAARMGAALVSALLLSSYLFIFLIWGWVG